MKGCNKILSETFQRCGLSKITEALILICRINEYTKSNVGRQTKVGNRPSMPCLDDIDGHIKTCDITGRLSENCNVLIIKHRLYHFYQDFIIADVKIQNLILD